MSQLIRKTVAGKKVNCEIFNSALEVASVNEQRTMTSNRFHDMKTHVGSDPEWFGVKNYDEAQELLRTGYQPVVENLNKAFKSTVMGEGKRFKFENNVHGFAPVVPLALIGSPNSMLNMTMKPIKAKVVDVFYDMTVSSNVSSNDQMKAGREVLAAIIDLEKQGYRFNLYAAITFTSRNDADIICIKIKSAEQPLDIKRVSFPMAHTGFFRVIGFDWYSKVPNGEYRIGYGSGAYYLWGKEIGKEVLEGLTGRKNVIYFSAAEIAGRDKDKDQIKEELTNDSKAGRE